MGFLLAEQQAFDSQHFNRPEWQISDWRGQKSRHVGMHIAKATLKICDGNRRQVVNEAVPDLAIYRAQLINTHELPEDIFDDTLLRVVSDNDVVRQLARASGHLATYTEDAEHGDPSSVVRLQRVSYAARHLHVAAESLAHIYDVDLEEAHAARLETLQEDPSQAWLFH
jgi:hypothetical protein